MKRTLGALAALTVLIALAADWAALSAWQQRFFGFRSGDGNGSHYLFFSGWGSIVLPPVLNGLALLAVLWWHHQCHVTGCWWYARRTTAANERACFVHHPHPKRTARDIRDAHHRALGLLHHGGERLYDAGRDAP